MSMGAQQRSADVTTTATPKTRGMIAWRLSRVS